MTHTKRIVHNLEIRASERTERLTQLSIGPFGTPPFCFALRFQDPLRYDSVSGVQFIPSIRTGERCFIGLLGLSFSFATIPFFKFPSSPKSFDLQLSKSFHILHFILLLTFAHSSFFSLFLGLHLFLDFLRFPHSVGSIPCIIIVHHRPSSTINTQQVDSYHFYQRTFTPSTSPPSFDIVAHRQRRHDYGAMPLALVFSDSLIPFPFYRVYLFRSSFLVSSHFRLRFHSCSSFANSNLVAVFYIFFLSHSALFDLIVIIIIILDLGKGLDSLPPAISLLLLVRSI